MDLLQELFDAYVHSDETEIALLETNSKLIAFIESNIPNNEKVIFLENIELIIKSREQYFFNAGFSAAKTLLMR